MTIQFQKGDYRARFAKTADDFASIEKLRKSAFRNTQTDSDRDVFDDQFDHVVVETATDNKLVGCFRFKIFQLGETLGSGYCAQFYDLTDLDAYGGVMMEIGRFCVVSQNSDPNILRAAWSIITKLVDQLEISLLFGCSSFEGVSREPYEAAFGVLTKKHIGPKIWRPSPKASEIVAFAQDAETRPNIRLANRQLPPLLRTYLTMGGWVSDHAVVDRELNTLHVFTAVEISKIPESRKRLLRADAQ